MEPAKPQVRYRWHRLKLWVACSRCGTNVVFQSLADRRCSSCGNDEKAGFDELLGALSVDELRTKNDGGTAWIGARAASLRFDHVETIACHHCQAALPTLGELTQAGCGACGRELTFDKYRDGLWFYASGAGPVAAPAPLVVMRCAMCGARVESDPAKEHYHCTYCDADNVVPPALRYREVVHDVFVGVSSDYYQRELAFGDVHHWAMKALVTNAGSYTHAELDQILRAHPNSSSVLQFIGKRLAYRPPEVLRALFDTSTDLEVIRQAGGWLHLATEAIDARIEQVKPGHLAAKKQRQREEQRKRAPARMPRGYVVGAAALAVVSAVYGGLLWRHKLGPLVRLGREGVVVVPSEVSCQDMGRGLLVGMRARAPDDSHGATWAQFSFAYTIRGEAAAGDGEVTGRTLRGVASREDYCSSGDIGRVVYLPSAPEVVQLEEGRTDEMRYWLGVGAIGLVPLVASVFVLFLGRGKRKAWARRPSKRNRTRRSASP